MHPIIMYETKTDSPCGFSLLLGSNKFCHLHMWWTDKNIKNSHKHLILNSINIARHEGYDIIDVGGDMRHLNLSEGLSRLYASYANSTGTYLYLKVESDIQTTGIIGYKPV